MFWKDLFRCIYRSQKRFFSLFFMVAIGSAMMVGLLSTSPMMQHSLQIHNQQYHRSDAEIFSTFGFDDADAANVEESIGNLQVMASRFVDTYAKRGNGKELLIRMEEWDRSLDQVELLEGRAPRNINEIVILQGSGLHDFKLNEELIIPSFSGKENNIWKIVGIGRSSQYLTHIKETSTLNNQKIDVVGYVLNSLFSEEEIKRLTLYFENREFDWNIEKEKIEEISSTYALSRKKKIVDEAKNQIEKAKRELLENQEKAEVEFKNNEQKLLEAKHTLEISRNEWRQGTKDLQKAREQIVDNEKELAFKERELNAAISQVEESSHLSLSQAITSLKEALNAKKKVELALSQIEEASITFDQLSRKKEQLILAIHTLSENKEQLLQKVEELQLNIAEIEELLVNSQSEVEKQELQQKKEMLVQQIISLHSRQQQLDQQSIDLERNLQEVTTALLSLDAENLPQKKAELLETLSSLATYADYEKLAHLEQLEQAKIQLSEGNEKLRLGREKLENESQRLQEAEIKLMNAEKEYTRSVEKFNTEKRKFQEEIASAEHDIYEAEKNLYHLSDAKWFILGPEDNYHRIFFQNTLTQMNAIASAIPLLFFLVAALVCLTTMTRLLEEERTQIGLYSALGFSSYRISFKYAMYALLASATGSLAGSIIGFLFLPMIIYDKWNLMYALPNLRTLLVPRIFLLGITSFSVLMFGVSWWVAHRNLRENPSQLLRPKSPKVVKKSLIERIPFLQKQLNFIQRITFRNILRYKARFFMTVVGVAGCTGLLVMGFGIKDSLKGIIQKQYGEIFLYQQEITFADGVDSRRIIEDLSLRGTPFLQYNTKVFFGEKTDSAIVQVFSEVDISKALHLREVNSAKPIKLSDGVAVSEKFALNHNLNVGSIIYLESDAGTILETTVDSIVEMYFQHYIFFSETAYRHLTSKEISYNHLALSETSEIHLAEDIGFINDFSPFIENFQNMIQALNMIILVVIVAAGSLAFVVLSNLTQVNISERTREIATLKVLGFTEKEIRDYLFKEIFILSFVGAIIGLLFGKWEHYFVIKVINLEQISFGKEIALSSYFLSFSLTILFTIMVLWITRRSLEKIEMVSSLKSVE